MTIDERLEQLTATVERLAEAQIKTDEAVRKTDGALRRAIRLGVREVRAERARRAVALADIDEKITKLASAQLVTEEKLQRFLDSMRGGNGKGNRFEK